jgi:hypothetical protein
MITESRQSNPFIYSTPDQIKDPKQAIDLFVDVFKDFYLVESPGNTFINGARGSGKSMMFRIMRPDCQKVKLSKKISDLSYFAVYIPVKDTSLNISELDFLKGKHGENIFNEHLMSTYFSIAIFKCFAEEEFAGTDVLAEVRKFYNDVFVKMIKNGGYDKEFPDVSNMETSCEIFGQMIVVLEEILNEFSMYIQRLTLGPDNFPYSGPLCLYRNFLSPIIKLITNFSFLPKDKPLYLLVDDADLLNIPQTKILNSWVSFRSTSTVCFKITTQLNYKTFQTTNSSTKIDSPHDYHEINLSDIYTSNASDRYKDNVKDMVERRLKYISKIDTTAEQFFPSNQQQEKDVTILFKKLEAEKGYDFAYRQARVDYMLNLRGNEYSYSYGGFEQLVHLSSGIIRNFIDLSFKMFDKAARENADVKSIPIGIQDSEIREYSDWILLQLDKTIEDKDLNPIQVSKYRSLKNLINSLGKTFRLYLEADSSERRKFSFYYDGEIDPEIKEVLKLGVSEGLFHYSTHGSKTGLGRSHKYVMNRILSPIYKLDPFSFSGYLYLTPQKIELAIKDEKRFLTYIADRIKNNDNEDDKAQLAIDF